MGLGFDGFRFHRFEKTTNYQLSFAVDVGVCHVLFSRESIRSLQRLDPYKVFDKFQLVVDTRCVFVNHGNMCLMKPQGFNHLFFPVWSSHRTLNPCHDVEFMRLLWISTIFLMFFRSLFKQLLWDSWSCNFAAYRHKPWRGWPKSGSREELKCEGATQTWHVLTPIHATNTRQGYSPLTAKRVRAVHKNEHLVKIRNENSHHI